MDRNLEKTLEEFFAPFRNNNPPEEEVKERQQKDLFENALYYGNRDERGCLITNYGTKNKK